MSKSNFFVLLHKSFMIIISKTAIKFFELILGKGISALAFYPFIFVHPDTEVTEELINHEYIHLKQQIELLKYV